MTGTDALPWGTAWRLARRELSARFRGLRLLLACLFLGVGALAAIGGLTHAIEQGLADRGRAILGGDVQISVWQRGVTAEETRAMAAHGMVSSGIRLQAMASFHEATAPVEVKAVDGKWPLVGELVLADGRRVGAPPQGSVWLGSGAAARLGARPGDRITLSGTQVTIAGIIGTEPDRLGEGFALGPTVITAVSFPQASGLVAPGAMYRTKLRVACARVCDAGAIAADLKARFPASGLDIRTRDNASPGAENFIRRMGDFLILVGLAALMIAGIGIGGGTASYLEARRGGIATLKVLGATSADITRIYLLQIGAAALVGSLAGIAGGMAAMPLLAHALAGLLPIDATLAISPWALLRGAVWGMLVALVFAAPPLAEARATPAMALLRSRVSPPGGGSRAALVPVGIGLAAIIALAFIGSAQPVMTATFLAGSAALFGLLGGLGLLIRRVAAHLPAPCNPLWRMGLANLHRPGAQTGRLVTALGFGLATFVLLAVVETSLDANITARVPAKAPDYFVMDLAPDRLPAFAALVGSTAPGARIRTVPALRGAILAYGPRDHMTRVADLPDISDDTWQLKGERGLTFAAEVPEGNALTQGQWWPANYRGEPLVSLDAKLADRLGLHLGDYVTIGLLGVERSARIASFRRIDWDSFGFNYVLVFSPNALEDAPHKLAATISLPRDGGKSAKPMLLRKLTRSFPSISVIEVGPLLGDARALLSQMSTAILAAASVAVLAGVAVLLGAIAAARASRLYDNTILRVLGASRGQLLAVQLAEYGTLAALLAMVAMALGSGLGWLIIVQLFHFDFLPDWSRVAEVLGAGLALTLGFALVGSIPLLRAKPAEALREL